MITAEFQARIRAPWTGLEPVRLGSVPPGLGTPNVFLTVSDDEKPLLRLDLYDTDLSLFSQEAISWRHYVAVGFGDWFYLVALPDRDVVSFDLGSYFGHLYPLPEFMLVASGQRLFCIDPQGALRWRSEVLGIDGVLVDHVKDGIIHRDGEWDPPG